MSAGPESAPESRPAARSPRRALWRSRAGRIALMVFLWMLGVVAVLLAGLSYYATTPSFQNRVRRAVVARLEAATGGHVSLGRFSWRLSHLEFEVDGLTIHGLEASDQVPYAHIDRLFVRLQILSFFRTKIGLNYLEADRPIFHLIVYPDGSTNQPHPRHPSSGNPVNTLFNLAINRTVLSDGLILLNERKIPFNLSASNLSADISYVPSRDHYVGDLHAEDITAQRDKELPVHSRLDASLDAGRNSARLVSLTLQSGPQGAGQKTVIRIAGSLENFANPRWQFTMKGAIDALEVRALAGVPGIEGGVAEIDASGHGAGPQFAIDGSARLSGAAYSTGTVHITGVTADALAHVNQDVIDVSRMNARLASGGLVTGSLHIDHWKQPAPGAPGTGRPVPERGAIRARISGFTLDSILDTVSPRDYRRLGFDTAASGTANADWTGSLRNLTGSVNVALAPPATPRRGETPMTGIVQASWNERTGIAQVNRLDVHTPASTISITGALGAYPPTQRSALNVSLVSTNLDEFNPVLATFGLAKADGSSPIPAVFHGPVQFHGNVAGSLMSPAFEGHLQAVNFDLVPRAVSASASAVQNVHVDSLIADASWRAEALDIRDATLIEGPTSLRLSGHVHGRSDRAAELFSASSAVEAQLQLTNLQLAPWLALTGKTIPVSGTLNLTAQTGGTLGNLNGNGTLRIDGGTVYGEQYHSLTGNLDFHGKSATLDNLLFTLDGGRVAGRAGYDFSARTLDVSLHGSGFSLSRIPRLQNAQYPVQGDVVFDIRGTGTLDEPSIQASLHVRDLNLARASSGFVDAEAHTQDHALLLHLAAHLNTATIELAGQTELRGNFQSRATLNIARFDIDPLLRTFSVTGIRGNSSIAAIVNVSGPLRTPRQLSGDARVSQLNLNLEGVPIRSDGAIHATLRDGTLHLDPLHIVGTDTNLHAQGSLGLFTSPRPLHLEARGGINMSLMQTLDTNIISSGHVDFNLDAEGTATAPALTGNVQFTNVNLALEDYINGLSRMNGSLVFYQNRLELKDVTAYSGGGPIKLGGFVTYHHGLFADVTATAKGVRIRYPQGVTATADASVSFQGTTTSSFLSGHVTITGFAISPDVDFASVAASTSGVSLPPNPNSPANQVRLDVRINSAPSLDFQNSFAKLAGNVELSIRGTLAQPTVLGRVTITEGSATFNGAKFQLQHGDIYFSNPVRIQPTIDLIATTDVEDYNITISLQGTTNKLNPTFRSEPPLSEQDIFSLLAMGRTQEEQQIYSTEQAQAGVNTTADAILGGALNATISSRIQKLFGGGSVRIDPTFVSGVGNATARITIQEPISRKATLTYATNVNSTAEQLIQGEWRVTPDFSVLAVRDEAGVFSLIFRLRRRYH